MEALRVNIADLRPWEYGNMEAWEYDRIFYTQQAYRQAMKDFPPGWDTVKPE